MRLHPCVGSCPASCEHRTRRSWLPGGIARPAHRVDGTPAEGDNRGEILYVLSADTASCLPRFGSMRPSGVRKIPSTYEPTIRPESRTPGHRSRSQAHIASVVTT